MAIPANNRNTLIIVQLLKNDAIITFQSVSLPFPNPQYLSPDYKFL